MSGNPGRHRRPWKAIVALATIAGGVVAVPMAAPAAAVTATITDCDDAETGLQHALDDPTVDVINLAQGTTCTGSYELGYGSPDPSPPGRPITLQGLGTGATFTGTGDHQLRLVNVGASIVRNLTFQGGVYSGSGAGVKVQGDAAPTFDHVTFTDDQAGQFGQGGGLSIKNYGATGTTTVQHSRFEGNTAGEGGGLFIDTTTDVVLTDNDFVGNSARNEGGGASISGVGDVTITLQDNVFDSNDVSIPGCQLGSTYGGGGLAIEGQVGNLSVGAAAVGDDGIPDVVQVHNRFEDNLVDRQDCLQATEVSEQIIGYGEYYGGGEWIKNAPLASRDDTFVFNVVRNVIEPPSEPGVGEAEGGGLAVQSFRSEALPVTASNLVLAGNEAQGEGVGGGAYFGGGTDGVDVTLLHATVTENLADTTGGGLAGGETGADDLVLQNSIVWGNEAGTGGESDLVDFGKVTANFSDVCATEAQPFQAGSGNNLCADPKLADPADGDVHQTAASPTRDAGSIALTGALAKDFEGDARIQDAGGDGPTPARPDMGADEEPAPAPKPEVKGDSQVAPGSIGEDDGYCLSAKDGGVFAFGGCQFFGAAGGGRVRASATDITAPQSLVKLNAPMIGIAMQPSDTGYWQVATDGGVFAFGTAEFHGSMGNTPLNKPIVGIASSPTGKGYWIVASDGGIFSFGDAPFLGSTGGSPINSPIVGITATPSGKGYWLIASDGGIFSYGDALFHGSAGGTKLNSPIVGMAARPGGLGYWLAAADGGVFTFGDAPFLGNRVGQQLNAPLIGIKGAASGNGYWLIAADGGVFSYGSAPFLGSTGDLKLNQPVIDMTG